MNHPKNNFSGRLVCVQVKRLDAQGRSYGEDCTVIKITDSYVFLRTFLGHVVRSSHSKICDTNEVQNHSTSIFSSTIVRDATESTQLFVGDKVLPLGCNYETGSSATVLDIFYLPSGDWEIAIATEDNTILHVEPNNVVKYCTSEIAGMIEGSTTGDVSAICFHLLSLLFPCDVYGFLFTLSICTGG